MLSCIVYACNGHIVYMCGVFKARVCLGVCVCVCVCVCVDVTATNVCITARLEVDLIVTGRVVGFDAVCSGHCVLCIHTSKQKSCFDLPTFGHYRTDLDSAHDIFMKVDFEKLGILVTDNDLPAFQKAFLVLQAILSICSENLVARVASCICKLLAKFLGRDASRAGMLGSMPWGAVRDWLVNIDARRLFADLEIGHSYLRTSLNLQVAIRALPHPRAHLPLMLQELALEIISAAMGTGTPEAFVLDEIPPSFLCGLICNLDVEKVKGLSLLACLNR